MEYWMLISSWFLIGAIGAVMENMINTKLLGESSIDRGAALLLFLLGYISLIYPIAGFASIICGKYSVKDWLNKDLW